MPIEARIQQTLALDKYLERVVRDSASLPLCRELVLGG
jgi:hypothetical protein